MSAAPVDFGLDSLATSVRNQLNVSQRNTGRDSFVGSRSANRPMPVAAPGGSGGNRSFRSSSARGPALQSNTTTSVALGNPNSASNGITDSGSSVTSQGRLLHADSRQQPSTVLRMHKPQREDTRKPKFTVSLPLTMGAAFTVSILIAITAFTFIQLTAYQATLAELHMDMLAVDAQRVGAEFDYIMNHIARCAEHLRFHVSTAPSWSLGTNVTAGGTRSLLNRLRPHISALLETLLQWEVIQTVAHVASDGTTYYFPHAGTMSILLADGVQLTLAPRWQVEQIWNRGTVNIINRAVLFTRNQTTSTPAPTTSSPMTFGEPEMQLDVSESHRYLLLWSEPADPTDDFFAPHAVVYAVNISCATTVDEIIEAFGNRVMPIFARTKRDRVADYAAFDAPPGKPLIGPNAAKPRDFVAEPPTTSVAVSTIEEMCYGAGGAQYKCYVARGVAEVGSPVVFVSYTDSPPTGLWSSHLTHGIPVGGASVRVASSFSHDPIELVTCKGRQSAGMIASAPPSVRIQLQRDSAYSKKAFPESRVTCFAWEASGTSVTCVQESTFNHSSFAHCEHDSDQLGYLSSSRLIAIVAIWNIFFALFVAGPAGYQVMREVARPLLARLAQQKAPSYYNSGSQSAGRGHRRQSKIFDGNRSSGLDSVGDGLARQGKTTRRPLDELRFPPASSGDAIEAAVDEELMMAVAAEMAEQRTPTDIDALARQYWKLRNEAGLLHAYIKQAVEANDPYVVKAIDRVKHHIDLASILRTDKSSSSTGSPPSNGSRDHSITSAPISQQQLMSTSLATLNPIATQVGINAAGRSVAAASMTSFAIMSTTNLGVSIISTSSVGVNQFVNRVAVIVRVQFVMNSKDGQRVAFEAVAPSVLRALAAVAATCAECNGTVIDAPFMGLTLGFNAQTQLDAPARMTLTFIETLLRGTDNLDPRLEMVVAGDYGHVFSGVLGTASCANGVVMGEPVESAEALVQLASASEFFKQVTGKVLLSEALSDFFCGMLGDSCVACCDVVQVRHEVGLQHSSTTNVFLFGGARHFSQHTRFADVASALAGAQYLDAVRLLRDMPLDFGGCAGRAILQSIHSRWMSIATNGMANGAEGYVHVAQSRWADVERIDELVLGKEKQLRVAALKREQEVRYEDHLDAMRSDVDIHSDSDRDLEGMELDEHLPEEGSEPRSEASSDPSVDKTPTRAPSSGALDRTGNSGTALRNSTAPSQQRLPRHRSMPTPNPLRGLPRPQLVGSDDAALADPDAEIRKASRADTTNSGSAGTGTDSADGHRGWSIETPASAFAENPPIPATSTRSGASQPQQRNRSETDDVLQHLTQFRSMTDAEDANNRSGRSVDAQDASASAATGVLSGTYAPIPIVEVSIPSIVSPSVPTAETQAQQ